MSKIKVTYDMTDPDDKADFLIDLQSKQAFAALYMIGQVLRSHEKHDSAALTRDHFHEILADNGVDMNLYS